MRRFRLTTCSLLSVCLLIASLGCSSSFRSTCTPDKGTTTELCSRVLTLDLFGGSKPADPPVVVNPVIVETNDVRP